MPQSYVTYTHDGDMLRNVDSASRDTAERRNNLNAAAYDILWISGFWMTETVFDELLILVCVATHARLYGEPRWPLLIQKTVDY